MTDKKNNVFIAISCIFVLLLILNIICINYIFKINEELVEAKVELSEKLREEKYLLNLKDLKIEEDEKQIEKMRELCIEDASILMNVIEPLKSSDPQEYLLKYKEIVKMYEGVIDAPETIYDCFNEEELNLLFGVVQAEVGEQYTFEQKANVANVIFNRLYSELFENDLTKVLSSTQFHTVKNGRYKNIKISETTKLACEYAFLFGKEETNECLFFDSNSKLRYEFIYNDGAHNFYRVKGD